MRNGRRTRDWEREGFQVVTELRDEEHAKRVCALRLSALEQSQLPVLTSLEERGREEEHGARSLTAQLYDRPDPSDDGQILSQRRRLWLLTALFALLLLASVAAHAWTIRVLFGTDVLGSVLIGVLLLGAVTVPCTIAFEYLAAAPVGRIPLALAIAALALAGSLLFAATRGDAVTVSTTATESDNYVDAAPMPDPTNENTPATADSPQESSAGHIARLTRDAAICLALSGDLGLGLLASLIVTIWTDPDVLRWRTLRKHLRRLQVLHAERMAIRAGLEMAKRHCMAGIVRGARQLTRKRQPPYLELTSAVLIAGLFIPATARAQTAISREEVMLLDASASVSAQGGNRELFADYLQAIKRLLQTEPPSSRVLVSLISSDSFGLQTILSGRTPAGAGVFVDDVDRARRQLLTAFESRTATITPSANATDIFGALWRITTLDAGAPGTSRDVYLFTDAVVETRQFDALTLAPLGAARMVQIAKARGLVAPLNGWRVHMVGVSTVGSTPQLWSTLKAFWTGYFHEAGASLVAYSAEPISSRQQN